MHACDGAGATVGRKSCGRQPTLQGERETATSALSSLSSPPVFTPEEAVRGEGPVSSIHTLVEST